MTHSDDTFHAAQRSFEEPPDDGPDYLADKPMGFCPWCDGTLHGAWFDGDRVTVCGRDCDHWEPYDTEDANRARYAAECEANEKLEDRMARDARKHGKGEFDE